MKITESLKKFNWPYAVYREIAKLKDQRKRLWADAVTQFKENPPEHGDLKDYKRAMLRHRVDFKEYNTYNFWRLSESERKKYLSERELKCIYRKVADEKGGMWFDNKLMTHIKFAKYMRRAWICPSLTTFDAFCQFVSSHDCIIKPWNGSLGQGVFMVKKDDKTDLHELYDKCRNNNLIVEERVRSCKEMNEFHPQSLNTIRVMTIMKGNRCEVIGCMYRMGVGEHVVDNGSAGGILAPIDLNTGVIGEGKDKKGKPYSHHPDSGKAIKGFVIPYWNNVIESCKEMASFVPEKIFAGWDVSVLETGEIELIEVNSGPNITGLQVSHGLGFRPRIQALSKDVLGYDVMKLISVWSKPYTNYSVFMRNAKRFRDPKLMLKDYVDYITENQESSLS